MKKNIVLLPGDGIGPEVVSATQQVLDAVAHRFRHEFVYQEYLIGGCSIDANGTALTDETLAACKKSDAILLGAVGGPKWDDPTAVSYTHLTLPTRSCQCRSRWWRGH